LTLIERETAMFEDAKVINSGMSIGDIQNKVLRNTYALLGLSMIPTLIGAYLGLHVDFSFMRLHPFIFSIGFLVVMFGMFQLISSNRNSVVGVWMLLATTFVFGLMLGPILQVALHLSNGAEIVGLAAAGTGITFLTLSGIASSPARDFSGLGQFLFVGLILVIIASLANMFFHFDPAHLVISAISVLIFSGYILYDVNQIVRGGETNYIMATLNIYLDIYNLFVNLLSILMTLMGNDRD
jgi:modulator of FtsH protease